MKGRSNPPVTSQRAGPLETGTSGLANMALDALGQNTIRSGREVPVKAPRGAF